MIEQFSFAPTEITGLIKVTPFHATDVRGSFTKDYSQEVFDRAGYPYDLAEVFYTTSRRGVIRAMHFQRVFQQPKLVRCLHGHVYDVVADLRPDSPTFKHWLAFDLTGENRTQILIPGGCAHGYLALADSLVSYKCSERFFAEYDDGVSWDDPDLAIDWPVSLIGGKDRLISADRDKALPSVAEFMGVHGGLTQ